jgi:ribose transport system substrate-binding protein
LKVTIKEVAKEAGVSIATVSHVINKTRYVSSDLIKKVDLAIEKTGYKTKISDWNSAKLKRKVICLIVPDISSRFFAVIAKNLENKLKEKDYDLIIYTYNEDKEREVEYLNKIISDKKVDGIIIAPFLLSSTDLKQLIDSKIPFIFIGSTVKGLEMNTILSDDIDGVYLAASHLIKYGHEKIGLLLWRSGTSINGEQIQGYKKALEEHDMKFDENLILITKEKNEELSETFKKYLDINNKPTAIICTNMKLTLFVLRFLSEHGLDCPKDISVVGYDNYGFGNVFSPGLTAISQFPDKIGETALDMLFRMISGDEVKPSINKIPVTLNVRESTQIISRGPFGEKAVYPDVLVLSESEIEKVCNGNYNAAISFHYSGKAWMRLIELGIKDVFNKLNIKLIAKTDAHFDANLQIKQLDSLLLQEPNTIISIPCDDIVTATSYQKIAKSNTRLILINNVPVGLKHGDYVTCISVNERENGHNAGMLLGTCFKNFKNVKIGLIVHGAPFFGTRQRDLAAEQVIQEEFKNIEIVSRESFLKEDRTYNICKEMIKANPEIQGIYVSWDGPALKAMEALSDLGREDISIVTCDLDVEVAINMAKGRMIKGISAQRPYEQGVAMAYAVANAMLGKNVPPFIGVKPYLVTPNNLSKAWKDIIKEKEPDSLLEVLSKNI